eukprot:862133-Prorocentrum_minimum.AAC.1
MALLNRPFAPPPDPLLTPSLAPRFVPSGAGGGRARVLPGGHVGGGGTVHLGGFVRRPLPVGPPRGGVRPAGGALCALRGGALRALAGGARGGLHVRLGRGAGEARRSALQGRSPSAPPQHPLSTPSTPPCDLDAELERLADLRFLVGRPLHHYPLTTL